jgi:hypothetical protein
MRYRVNHPAVVHQAFDGEVILVNLEHGHYYSLEKASAAAFEALASGRTEAEVASELATSCQQPLEGISSQLARLVGRLVEEGLLVPRGERPPDPPASALPLPPGAFETLQLAKYTDMQDLLLLDPIHEVDDTGWPVLRK